MLLFALFDSIRVAQAPCPRYAPSASPSRYSVPLYSLTLPVALFRGGRPWRRWQPTCNTPKSNPGSPPTGFRLQQVSIAGLDALIAMTTGLAWRNCDGRRQCGRWLRWSTSASGTWRQQCSLDGVVAKVCFDIVCSVPYAPSLVRLFRGEGAQGPAWACIRPSPFTAGGKIDPLVLVFRLMQDCGLQSHHRWPGMQLRSSINRVQRQ